MFLFEGKKMSIVSYETSIMSNIELYFKFDGDKESKTRYNLCGKLKDESKLFLGWYHFHNIIEDEDGCFTCTTINEGERDHQAFEIFQSLANSPVETIETYYARFMLGFCYLREIGIVRDKEKACEWLNKAIVKELPKLAIAVGRLYAENGLVKEAIIVYEWAFNFGVLSAAEEIFKLYASNTLIKDFDKAYYWSLKAPELDLTSRDFLYEILRTGHFDWTQRHHRYFSAYVIRIPPNICPNDTLDYIKFGDQVFVILLISKFRLRSNFKFTHLLTRDIGICIIRQLSRFWFSEQIFG